MAETRLRVQKMQEVIRESSRSTLARNSSIDIENKALGLLKQKINDSAPNAALCSLIEFSCFFFCNFSLLQRQIWKNTFRLLETRISALFYFIFTCQQSDFLFVDVSNE